MKRVFSLVVLLAALWSGSSFAQSWVEEQNTVVAGGEVSPQIDGLLFHSFTSKLLGSYIWFQVSEAYAQTYAGPTFSPTPWSQLGVAVGLEQADDPLRYAGFVWLGKGRVSLVAIGENGGSGWWYKSETNFKASNVFGIGTIVQRFFGAGVRSEINLILHLKVWGAILRDGSKTNGAVGFRFTR